ncbi:hypothetical protein [Actinophytocola xanthii]|uniref:SCO6045-like C-terminal domain-containing protein n=1 Tax=Actinophytocola xanthii TaxID=1912961 RepID=A0A1Q8CMG7_9PSEU|nr:hypothetical protein [Actinophytocola xanthii]OLF15551.1 hypothetical protein BU204_21770 [Actinophytocola xanthii]
MTDLAARQAELVRALLADGPVPAGFDPDRVRAEAAALLAKRRGVAARLRPDLAATLGDRFRPLFDTWARENPRRAGESFRADLDAFARWLQERERQERERRSGHRLD